ncbi:hypothetical protein Misp03_04850 [Microbispora sp. NBRC 16548]|nr:hypothetical protein Misp03_04850 [Microbispora sp. NBRC 16548]
MRGCGPDVESSFGHRLHHVQLAVPPGAEDDCRAFYVGVLGMTAIGEPPVLAARGGPATAASTPTTTSATAWSTSNRREHVAAPGRAAVAGAPPGACSLSARRRR